MATKSEINAVIDAALMIAYEAGRWCGQVDLEEHYDNEQYKDALLEGLYAKRTAMPLYDSAVNRRTVNIELRSDEWREGARKTSQEYVENARQLIYQFIETKHKQMDKNRCGKTMEIIFDGKS